MDSHDYIPVLLYSPAFEPFRKPLIEYLNAILRIRIYHYRNVHILCSHECCKYSIQLRSLVGLPFSYREPSLYLSLWITNHMNSEACLRSLLSIRFASTICKYNNTTLCIILHNTLRRQFRAGRGFASTLYNTVRITLCTLWIGGSNIGLVVYFNLLHFRSHPFNIKNGIPILVSALSICWSFREVCIVMQETRCICLVTSRVNRLDPLLDLETSLYEGV